jgi:hypothetical protein
MTRFIGKGDNNDAHALGSWFSSVPVGCWNPCAYCYRDLPVLMENIMKYILIDDNLVPRTAATDRWLQRAGRAVPQEEPEDDHVAVDTTDRRSDWEVLEGLEEIE